MIVKKLLSVFTRAEKLRFGGLLIAILVMGFLEVIGIASILPFMQLLAEPDAVEKSAWLKWGYEYFGFDSSRNMLVAMGISVIVLISISNAFAAFTVWLQFKYSWRAAHDLAMRLLRTYLRKPYHFFLNKNSSELCTYLVSEVGGLTSGVLIPLIEFTSRGIVSLVILGLLVWVDWKVAFTMAGVLGGAYLLIFLLQKKLLKTLGEHRIASNLLRYKNLSELLTGIKTVKVSGKQDFYYSRYESASKEFTSVQPKVSMLMATPRYFLEVFAFGGILAVTLYLYAQGGNLQAALPRLSLYAVAGYRLLPALQRAFTAVSRIKHFLPALEKLQPDLYASLHPEIADDAHLSRLPFRSTIVLKDLAFHYENTEQLVVNKMNMTIEKGEIVAFIGSTGAGKTTLIDLMVGLLHPTAGQILIDGKALTKTSIAAWQKHIAYVPQEVFLFDDTVANNIALGQNVNEIDYKWLKEVAKMADIYNFIVHEMPNGFEEKIGERGVRLSGGQRQRLGLARALYSNPSVLVLDEATSALDNITENSIIESLKALPDDMTIFIIAHRLSTVRHADCIYLLENGNIKAKGNYEALQKESETFQAMVHLA